MKTHQSPHLRCGRMLQNAVASIALSLGLSAGVSAQFTDPETVSLWREWMSVLQREQTQTSGPRIYVMTDREIRQTGPSSAQFQNGRYRFLLADGSVPDTDGDVDGYTDLFEDRNICADRDDPALVPGGNMCVPLPRDTWAEESFAPVLLANGSLMGIAESTVESSTQAVLVKPQSGSAVRIANAPASKLPRPFSMSDYSGSFYYYFSRPGQSVGAFIEFPLSLYHVERRYESPSDVNTLESSIVPGVYGAEFPTIQNAPFGKSAVNVAHRLVPNGSLSVGLKKPTWLVRSLTNTERFGVPPVTKTWVDGRLKFDPYLPATFTWDNIVQAGLASPVDFIELWLEDEESGFRVSFTYRFNASRSSLDTDTRSAMNFSYGTIRKLMQDGNFPFTTNGNIVLKYYRYANGQSAADLSTVTVRVPAQFSVSYAAWRNELFPTQATNDSISGPNADPDGDGLTNQQEYEAGSDPGVSAIGIANPTAQNVTTTNATLGATVVSDSLSSVDVTILERGVIYSPTAVNSSPVLDAPGVIRQVSSPAESGPFEINVTGLTPGTQYSYRGYVISSLGVSYTSPVTSFTTVAQPQVTLPTVTNPVVTTVAGVTATLGGNVTSNGGSPITERGVVYSVRTTNDNPFIGGTGVTKAAAALGTGTGTFTVNITGLVAGTTYTFRAYAINALGTAHTTNIGTFTTAASPTITSPTVTDVTSTSARLGGNVTSGGGVAVTQRGVVFSQTSVNNNPLIGGNGVTTLQAATSGTGIFTINATGLLPSTAYTFKAFAINIAGTSYTANGTFTTGATLPTIGGLTITNLTSVSVTLGANVTATGQSAITERGFVYSPTALNSSPAINGPGVIKVTATLGQTGVYTSNISGLTPSTGYTFRAYATNAVGTGYSSPFAFFTTFPPLTVTSPTVTDVTDASATLGGTVVSDGGTTATGRGVVLSQNALVPPAIGGPGVRQVTATGTMGTFSVPVPSLLPNTTYYFRAYATNSAGPSYSALSSFKTLPLQLRGLSDVDWLPAEQRQFAPRSDGGTQNDPRLTRVPRFIYTKTADDQSKSINYLIETTNDFFNWSPINREEWRVNETETTLEAIWISQDPSPSSIFFRVKGTVE